MTARPIAMAAWNLTEVAMPRPRPSDLILGTVVATREGKEIRLARVKNDASEETIKAITDFYNANFREEHTVPGRKRRYADAAASPLNLALVSDGAIVGLLESRLVTVDAMGKERVRLLATLLIDPGYRGLRLSTVICDEFTRRAERGLRVLVRFRDGNRKNLERLYRGLGFSRLEEDGEYGRSKEKRWRMVLGGTDLTAAG
jgi:hypothetical protein